MKSKVLGLISVVLLTMAFAPGASAFPFPIPVGSTSADDLIFNFDFTSQTPPPPYELMAINMIYSGEPFPSPNILTIDFFAGVNGADYLFSHAATAALGLDHVETTEAKITDGIFSIGFRVNAGTDELTSFIATESAANGSSGVTISGVPASVPEPTTLALLGIGLAGLGFSRRRKLN